MAASTYPAASEFDNSGTKPLYVPGFNAPVDFEYDAYGARRQRFAHGANEWSQDPRLTVRELAMLALMNALTDKPSWHTKVFDADIVAKWRSEALAMASPGNLGRQEDRQEPPLPAMNSAKPLISEKAWAWCLEELRDKARVFEENGWVPALDSGSGCVKSDGLVSEELRAQLVNAVRPLLDEVPAEERDWQPRSNEQVLNLVHPSLFPLVYGRTRVLVNGGQVGLKDFLAGYEQAETATKPTLTDRSQDRMWRSGNHSEDNRFSTKFQWLPCEVGFAGDTGNDVKITSYINNLHPVRYEKLYSLIEKLISLSIELWNQVLVYQMNGSTPIRIRTYGYEFDPPYPKEIDDLYDIIAMEKFGDEKFQAALERTKELMKLPDNPDYDSEHDIEEWEDDDELELKRERFLTGTFKNKELPEFAEWKWKRVRRTRHPEPGDAYSYADWTKGQVDNAVVKSSSRYTREYKEPPQVDLAETWREKGLQVIVKLASIELTPEKPEYAGGSWHVEGMLNEHIVATSIHYYDVSNTTESRIRFRQEATLDNMDMSYEQDEHEPLCEIFGTESLRDELAEQELGSIATPQGRLLVFPNTLQHCVQPFRLADATRPGHRRFVVLWLVDPHYRVVSTRNVPPQQHHWWAPEAFDKLDLDSKLPAELANIITEDVGQWPMGLEEAKTLRLELMDERTAFVKLVEGDVETYNFCEH
ncbi:hypothetical protein BDV95DRAFT_610955 [Massariosphaeria phaeospora]|uniref:Uncharacterized protein n=1 Tax=Massariosphaeria phaeospora TaxID=100035 RepID=A0A7C8I3C8_9PLEO|nr:hypothetical protein BDV95DRAFT_610955 [Massariosphaeria phaeospora]